MEIKARPRPRLPPRGRGKVDGDQGKAEAVTPRPGKADGDQGKAEAVTPRPGKADGD